MADLSALLEKEASTEIEAILSEARQRASEIAVGASSEAQALEATRARAVKSQSEALLVRAKSAAQLEASSLRLTAQHDAVQGVFAAVSAQVDELLADPARYPAVFAKLLAEAVAGAGGQALQALVVGRGDEALAEKAVADAGLGLPVETADDVRGGVRLRTVNHSVIENTLHGRLEALRGELASEVSAALFGAKAG
ncbi:MAG: V-type ATP synthase subunit E [Trueperaceae bacterium]|nr:V-type ATP synthase subunit E [Trueperaceae bacterium]